jgi:serine/threonine protein kinase
MDNIMIDENETIKIIDFGFAINKNETNLIEERCGTIDYMAPEVLNEEEYDEKADIYSLA